VIVSKKTAAVPRPPGEAGLRRGRGVLERGAAAGEKDWQQLVMFQRMAEDLRLPSRVLACPTVREPDGLAISGRNAKLTPPLERLRDVSVPAS
jgi:pantothenate synthetase